MAGGDLSIGRANSTAADANGLPELWLFPHESRVADTVRLWQVRGLCGRQRLGASDEFDGVVDAQVPHPTLTVAQARAEGEFVERLKDDGTQQGLIAIAPHGGAIEPYTDQQAERVATRLATQAVSSWRCKGWAPDGDPFGRWHITSGDICEGSFPHLGSVISRGFTHAVAFHGFDEPAILSAAARHSP